MESEFVGAERTFQRPNSEQLESPMRDLGAWSTRGLAALPPRRSWRGSAQDASRSEDRRRGAWVRSRLSLNASFWSEAKPRLTPFGAL